MNCPQNPASKAVVERIAEAARGVLSEAVLDDALNCATQERTAILTEISHRLAGLRKEIQDFDEILAQTKLACLRGDDPKERFDLALTAFVQRFKEEDLKHYFGASFARLCRLGKVHLIHRRWKEALNGKEGFSRQEKREFYRHHFQGNFQLLNLLEEKKDLKKENDLLEEEIRQMQSALKKGSWMDLITDNLFFQLGKGVFLAGEKVLPMEEPYRTAFSTLAGLSSYALRLSLIPAELFLLQSLILIVLSEPDLLLALGKALGHREEIVLENYPLLLLLTTLGLTPLVDSDVHYLYIGCLAGSLILASLGARALQRYIPMKGALHVASTLIGLYAGHKLFEFLFAQEEELAAAYQAFGVEEGVSFDQIKKLYHQMALKEHPDKSPNGDFTQLTAAYNLLKEHLKKY